MQRKGEGEIGTAPPAKGPKKRTSQLPEPDEEDSLRSYLFPTQRASGANQKLGRKDKGGKQND